MAFWTPAWTFSPSRSPGKLWLVRSAKSCPGNCQPRLAGGWLPNADRARRRIAYNQRSGSRHMTESGTDSTTLTWSVPECPFTIEASARVLDDIRLAVTDAFFSLPRGVTESGTDSTTLTWSVPECPFTIEASARVLDDIRLAVTDAFFSLPRGGAEIGGILLGKFEDGRLVISDYAALDCEHAYGPSFVLSPPDEAG